VRSLRVRLCRFSPCYIGTGKVRLVRVSSHQLDSVYINVGGANRNTDVQVRLDRNSSGKLAKGKINLSHVSDEIPFASDLVLSGELVRLVSSSQIKSARGRKVKRTRPKMQFLDFRDLTRAEAT
jgi:hypothetical protein